MYVFYILPHVKAIALGVCCIHSFLHWPAQSILAKRRMWKNEFREMNGGAGKEGKNDGTGM